MIVVLSAVGAVAVVALAVAVWWPGAGRRPRDPDWGDWPPDQMGR